MSINRAARRIETARVHIERATHDLEAATRSLQVAARIMREAGKGEAAKALDALANDLIDTAVWDDAAGILDDIEDGKAWVTNQ